MFTFKRDSVSRGDQELYDLVANLSTFHLQVILGMERSDQYTFYEFITSGHFRNYLLLDHPIDMMIRIPLAKPTAKILISTGRIIPCYF